MMTPALWQLFRFGVVGGVGFLVDGGLLWVVMTGGASAFVGRLFSFPVAVLSTWWLNRIWTFTGASRARPGRQLNRYVAVQIVGALTNFALYSVILMFFEPNRLNALGAFAVGSVAGMFVNYFGSKRFVFEKDAPVTPSASYAAVSAQTDGDAAKR